MNVRRSTLLAFLGLLAVASPAPAIAFSLTPVPIGKVAADLYDYSLTLVGLAVFVMFLLAGLAQIVPSLQKRVGSPMAIIKDAIIGFIILVSAYVILNSISRDLVKAPLDSAPSAQRTSPPPTPPNAPPTPTPDERWELYQRCQALKREQIYYDALCIGAEISRGEITEDCVTSQRILGEMERLRCQYLGPIIP